MSDLTKFGFGFVIAGVVACCIGCADNSPPAPPATPSDSTAMPPSEMPPSEPAPTEGNPEAAPGVEGDAASAAPAAGEDSEAAKIEASLASFSAEDRALVAKQKICPISGEPLGAMGTPIKVEVAGNTVFICCEHCEDPLISDPAKHLAKIGLEPKDEAAVPQ